MDNSATEEITSSEICLDEMEDEWPKVTMNYKPIGRRTIDNDNMLGQCGYSDT
jgi:hypothetical protein